MSVAKPRCLSCPVINCSNSEIFHSHVLSNHILLLLHRSNTSTAWFHPHLWSFSHPRAAETPLLLVLITPCSTPSVPLLHCPSAAHRQQNSTLAQSSYMSSLLLNPGSWMLLAPWSIHGLLPQRSPAYCREVMDVAPSSLFLFLTSAVCQISLFFLWPLPSYS